MQAAAHGAALGCPEFNAFGYIEHHPSNILTSASFNPPPEKSFLEKLVEFLNRSIQP